MSAAAPSASAVPGTVGRSMLDLIGKTPVLQLERFRSHLGPTGRLPDFAKPV